MKNKWSKIIFFKEGRVVLIVFLFSLIASGLIGYLIPLKIKALSLAYTNHNEFIHQEINLLLIFLAIFLLKICYGLSSAKYGILLIKNIRTEVYSTWLFFDECFVQNAKNKQYVLGEIMSRVMSDTEAARDLIQSGTFSFIVNLIFICAAFISFFQINYKLGISLAILEIATIFLFVLGSKKMREAFFVLRKTNGEVSHVVANTLGGIGQLFFNKHNDYIIKRSKKYFQKYLNNMSVAIWWDSAYFSFAEMLTPLYLVAVFFLLPYVHLTHAALILVVLDLINRSVNPIKSMAGQIGTIQRAYGSMFRIHELLHDLENKNDLKIYSNDMIKVQQISLSVDQFSYINYSDLKPKRNNFNKETNPNNKNSFLLSISDLNLVCGKKYAFVGLSGCVKSTLLKIISGEIIPAHYKLQMNDSNIDFKNQEKFDLYRKHVGLISQDSHVFSRSLAFNLSFDDDINNDLFDFWEKIKVKIPFFYNWNINLKDILDVKSLSAGQKQLIAAIRSLYLKKEIVLFDEISSSLDSKLEKSLSIVTNFISKQSITIFVAHRIETIINSDSIFVMSNGKIISQGGHKRLEKESTLYQNFLKELRK